jgi:hypothetical protein
MPVWEQAVIRVPASRGITAPSVTGLTLSLEMLIVLLLCRASGDLLARRLQQGGIRTAYAVPARRPRSSAGGTGGQGIGSIGETTATGAEGAHDLLLLRAHHLTQGPLPQLIGLLLFTPTLST